MHHYIFFVIISRTVTDLLFKYSVSNSEFNSLEDLPQFLVSLFLRPIFWLAISLAVLTSILWVYTLNFFDLSYAYPFLSISFVTIILGGRVFFNEHIGLYKVIGLSFILLGSFFMVIT